MGRQDPTVRHQLQLASTRLNSQPMDQIFTFFLVLECVDHELERFGGEDAGVEHAREVQFLEWSQRTDQQHEVHTLLGEEYATCGELIDCLEPVALKYT
jgi:hypothetical protein